MEYFWLKQDKRYVDVPHIHRFAGTYRRSDFTVEHAYKIADRNVVFVNSEHRLDYTDVIDRQIFLVSEDVKSVFKIYDLSITFKTFCLLDNVHMDLKLYYAPIIPLIDGTDEPERFCQEGRRDREPVIRRAYLKSRPIVRLRDLPPDGVVIRLDVAESLLRRGLFRADMARLALARV